MRPHSATEIRQWLIDRIADYLDLPIAEVDATLTWDELGMVSRDAVALSGELETYLQTTLPQTIAWEHPTIAGLVDALTECDDSGATTRTAVDSTASGQPATGDLGPVVADHRATGDAVAVVGIGCRFPGGAAGPEEFWRLLTDRRDGIGTVPAERWASFDDGSAEVGAVLRRTTRFGGFLDDIAGFDSEFFGIAGVEAAVMDPQQRLLLEVAVEALDHAGVHREQLRGSATGVFVGACSTDYAHLTTAELADVDAWTGTGAAMSIIANRLSYVLDLRGPSLVVDTACSSSLVAVHLACQSLYRGESTLAIAGGVNLLLSPAATINFDRAGAMAADGRCKTFDASADGYVRGEGCGVVVLKLLRDALRDGNTVLALVRGSAIGSDGRSNGLMAPNPPAQQAMLTAAYRSAGVDPSEVDYVEAHGTGTALGDSMEVGALAAVCGKDRQQNGPLLVGSVKTNIGHLEAAAGVAGLIKTTLALAHGELPATLHFSEPNPRIDFAGIRVPVERTPWPRRGRPALAGVSAFGFGGTNAHAVLEQAANPAPDAVWVFSGQGSQWPGMGARLLIERPEFAAAVDEIEEVVAVEGGFSLRELLAGDLPMVGIDRIQPALYAMHIGLAALWRAAGARPAAVIGHSMGEVAAAVTAGVLTAVDGARLIVRRSALMVQLAGTGAMAAIELGAENTAAMSADLSGVAVAVYAGPRQTIVSGPSEQVLEFLDRCARESVVARLIDVDVASHCALVDPLLPAVVRAASNLDYRTPVTTFYSTVVPGRLRWVDAGYWAANLRRSVRFRQAVDAALADGHTRFVEVSPHPVLSDAIVQTAGGRAVTVLPTLRRDRHSFSPLHPPLRTWRHQRHWVGRRRGSGGPGRPRADTLLGTGVAVPTVPASVLWQCQLLPESLPYPRAHLVGGVSIVPGSVLINTALQVAGGALAEVVLPQPLTLDAPRLVQVVEQGGRVNLVSQPVAARAVTVAAPGAAVTRGPARDAAADGAPDPAIGSIRHLTGKVAAHPADPPLTLPELPAGGAEQLAGAHLHGALDDGAVQPAYLWRVESLVRSGSRADVLVSFPDPIRAGGAAVLDAALTLAAVAFGRPKLLIPARIQGIMLGAEPAGPVLLRYHQRAPQLFDLVAECCDSVGALTITGMFCQDVLEPVDTGQVLVRQVSWSPIEITLPVGDPVAIAPVPNGEGADLVEQVVNTCWQITERLRALIAQNALDPTQPHRLTVLTTGMRAADRAWLAHAAVWGLAQVVAEEHPEIWGGIVDLDPDLTEINIGAVLEPGMTVRGFAPELKPVDSPVVRGPLACRPDGAYLITGGLGALGRQTAGYLADRGARRLVLLGRTALPPRSRWADEWEPSTSARIGAVLDLESAGVSVEIAAVDLTDPGALHEWLTGRDRLGLPRITGVVHTAGTTKDVTLDWLAAEDLRSVVGAKVGGAVAIDQAFPPGTLDFLVFFSSAAVLHGGPGQGAYAAANACLDALARVRAAEGCHTLSLDWGAWAGLGMANSAGGRLVEATLAAGGLRSLRVPEAMAAWDRVHRHDVAQALVVAAAGGGVLPAALGGSREHREPADWQLLPDDEQLSRLQLLVAEELGLDPAGVDVDRTLAELGMDSILSLRIRHRIQADTGLEVGVTAAWNYPTVRAMTGHLRGLKDREAIIDGTAALQGPAGIESLLRSVELGSVELGSVELGSVELGSVELGSVELGSIGGEQP